MSDNAKCIFASAKKINGISNAKHLNCFVHLKERQQKFALAENRVFKEDRVKILEHIKMMHMMITEDHFKKYWELFKIKYSNYKEYLNYFEKTYISSESNKWHYFDVLPNVFLTNNICESLNATIKRDWTNRERKPFHIFLNILKEALIDLAKEGKIYKFKVEIKSEMKFLATQLEAKKLFVKKKDYYFLDKEEKKRIEINQINQYFDLKYTDVDSFQADQLSMVILRLYPSTKKATCFCKFGFTKGMC